MMTAGNHLLLVSFLSRLRAYTVSLFTSRRERMGYPTSMPSRSTITSMNVPNYGRIGIGANHMLNLCLSVKRECILKVLCRPAMMGHNFFASISNSTSNREALSRKLNKDIVLMVDLGELDVAHFQLSKVAAISNIDLDIGTFSSVMDGWVNYQKDLAAELHLWTDTEDNITTQLYSKMPNYVPAMVRLSERIEDILHLVGIIRSSSWMGDDGNNKYITDGEGIKLQKKYSMKPSTHHYNAVISSWTRIMKCASLSSLTGPNIFLLRGIPQRVTTYLERMENLSLDHTSGVWPTVGTYNDVMEAWGFSKEHRAAFMAESIFRRLMVMKKSVMAGIINETSSTFGIGTNMDRQSHRIMIRAWCRSDQTKGAAFYATIHLTGLMDVLEYDNDNTELTLDDYLLVFECWSKAPEQDKASRETSKLLYKMDILFKEGLSTVRPNADCYKYALMTLSCANIKHVRSAGLQSERLVLTMKERGLFMDEVCFASAIRTWSKSASFHAQSLSSFRDAVSKAARKADEMLKSMTDMYHRTSSDVLVKPRTVNYNDVILAWSECAHRDAALRAEELLSMMESLYAEGRGNVNVKPDGDSYACVMFAWAKIPEKGRERLERTLDLLLRARKGGVETVECRNTVIALCGSIDIDAHVDEGICVKALRAAIETSMGLNGLATGNKCERNSMTYSLLLRAVGTLLPYEKKERQSAIVSVFDKCCAEGLVDDNVMESFRKMAPIDIYRRTVVIAADDDKLFVLSKTLPDKWTKNVRGKGIKVAGVDGHGIKRMLPLTVEGKFVSRSNHYISEHKMRRLRSKYNQQVFRGGRMGNC